MISLVTIMKSLIFICFFTIFSLSPVDASDSRNKDKFHVSSHKIAKSVFYSGTAKAGEWIVSGLLLNGLDELGKNKSNTFFGTATIRGKWFSDNRESVKQFGCYVGSTLGILVGISTVEYIVPMGEHVYGCWIRCGESIWEWDSTKSSRRDKIIACLSAGFGLALFNYRGQIMETLWGKDWRKFISPIKSL